MARFISPLSHRVGLVASLIFSSTFLFYIWRLDGDLDLRSSETSHNVTILPDPPSNFSIARSQESYSRTLVIAKTLKEDVSWIFSSLPGENLWVYIVDDEPEKLRIPENKGREAMVYLTYLIDNYDSLPDISVFFHAHEFAWHNNILHGQNSANMIQSLSNAHVNRVGYMPARCSQNPGCPHWLRLDLPAEELDMFNRLEEKYFTSTIWKELHPDIEPPSYISAPCCSQFALSRERILSHPVTEYVRYRDWLLNTTLDDEISGRWMEYSWHILFTGEVEFCPSQNNCYCDGYGICFGGEQYVQDWLDRKSRKDDMHLYANELKRRNEAENYFEINKLRAYAAEMEIQLGLELDAAIERGNDPKVRAAECGREWNEGDGF